MHEEKDRIYSKCDVPANSCHKLLLPPTQNSVRFMRLRGARFHMDSQLNLQLIHHQHLNPRGKPCLTESELCSLSLLDKFTFNS